jgi:molybdopterin converting factor small subunit
MKIRLKLYALLSDYLPEDAADNQIELELADGATPHQLIDRHGLPREMAHLILRNGVYISPEDRDKPVICDGDTIAVWPPVAGG